MSTAQLEKYKRQNIRRMTKAERAFRALFVLSFSGIEIEPQKIIQRGVSGYLIDFYLPYYLIGIEIDGASHNKPEQIIYDNERTEYLKIKGIKILRLANLLVRKRTGKCIEIIKKAIAIRTIELKKDVIINVSDFQPKITVCPPYTERDYKRAEYERRRNMRGQPKNRKLTMIRNRFNG